jgi:lauroyl/myristoyl acyltransferase
MGRVKRLRRTVRYPLLRAALWLLEVLPRPAALPIGRFLGDVVWRFHPGVRTKLRENLLQTARVFPIDPGKVGRQCLRTLGSNPVGFLRLHRFERLDLEGLVRVEGEEHLVRGLARGRGVVVATGHLGNWE